MGCGGSSAKGGGAKKEAGMVRQETTAVENERRVKEEPDLVKRLRRASNTTGLCTFDFFVTRSRLTFAVSLHTHSFARSKLDDRQRSMAVVPRSNDRYYLILQHECYSSTKITPSIAAAAGQLYSEPNSYRTAKAH